MRRWEPCRRLKPRSVVTAFDLSEEQAAIRHTALEFARSELAPHAVEWDQTKHFPVETLRRAASLGMGGITIAEELGGSGLSALDAALIFEALVDRLPVDRRLSSPSTTWRHG